MNEINHQVTITYCGVTSLVIGVTSTSPSSVPFQLGCKQQAILGRFSYARGVSLTSSSSAYGHLSPILNEETLSATQHKVDFRFKSENHTIFCEIFSSVVELKNP